MHFFLQCFALNKTQHNKLKTMHNYLHIHTTRNGDEEFLEKDSVFHTAAANDDDDDDAVGVVLMLLLQLLLSLETFSSLRRSCRCFCFV